MDVLTLKTGAITMEFNAATGALTGMTAEDTGWKIQRRAELGLSWRLLVPIGDEVRDNPVFGEKQTLTHYHVTPDHIELTWEGVISERAGRLDITVTQRIRAEGRQAVYYTRVENRSPYIVESVYSPYIGDLSRPEGSSSLRSLFPGYASAAGFELWPTFDQNEGCHGVDYPTQFIPYSDSCGAPAAPFFLLLGEKEGLYAGIKANSAESVTWHCELRPGYDSSIDGRVPEGDEISGTPVRTLFAPVHMCYIAPDETRDLTPIALEPFAGGWQEGADIYRAWRRTWAKKVLAPAWARDVHAWLQIHINSPEDELRFTFKELPDIAAECVRCGVKAIQLVGWNIGGQDRNNPSHSYDPRLGTFEEFKDAIAKCQAMGVKIILFAKFTWAERSTARFREELIRDAIKDPYGDYYMHSGYEYQTPAQLLGVSTRRLIPMCFGSAHYIEVCREEFKKLVALGCDGMLYDECQHHMPAILCFDPSHGHRVGWPVYTNDRAFIEMLRKTEGLKSDFLFAGEACYDWEFEEYHLAYFRSWSRFHVPMTRYLNPDAQLMTAIVGFNDRNMLNQCLMYRYIISYEPYNFKGRLSDFPLTVEYGRKIDDLRREYRAHLWEGEFKGEKGARVFKENGEKHEPYARFEAADGSSALVICNYDDAPCRLSASMEKGRLNRFRLVDDPKWHAIEDGIEIPPRSAALAM